MAWLVESLPSNPEALLRNFHFYPWTGCMSFVFCPVLSLTVALTLYSPHIQGHPTFCICLVFGPHTVAVPTGI